MPPEKLLPLSAGERARLHSIVSASDPDLAERAVDELDGDPIARAVTQLTQDLTSEMRQLRTQVLWVVVLIVGLGMVLQAAMVGVGLTYSGGGHTFSTQPQSRPAISEPLREQEPPRAPHDRVPTSPMLALPPHKQLQPVPAPVFDWDDTDAVGSLEDTK